MKEEGEVLAQHTAVLTALATSCWMKRAFGMCVAQVR